MDREELIQTMKAFILERFLPEEDPANLEPATRMVSRGVLDSLATLEVVSFMEDTFKIKVEAHEVNIDNISTSEIVVSCIVRSEDGPRALRCLHEAFGLDKDDEERA